MTLFAVPGITVNAGFDVGYRYRFDLDFGYDTRGFRDFIESNKAADLLNGFYVADTDAGSRQAGIPESKGCSRSSPTSRSTSASAR